MTHAYIFSDRFASGSLALRAELRVSFEPCFELAREPG
jgi:hypothetical protein